ncbi:MAG TPA: phytanoyl-CoA dioxygenase family protein [Chthonomonadaceae bacterium]|nr:phytanoyl-CoA dioxygenase family protein [Chthonomonadaceae bacterium]
MKPAVLTQEQRAAFERDGFLVVPNVLPPAMVARLTEVVDRLYEQGVRAQGLSKTNHWQLRNCIVEDDLFLELLDWPATVPLVVDLLNWNIHLITSHLIVRAPSPPEADAHWKAENWHRDGGTSAQEMLEPHPRLLIKIAYWLSDLSAPGRGNIRFVPGSHRLIGRPAQADDAPDPYGAIEICAHPGDAVLFEQRTYHAVGPNRSHITRKSLFFGYGYRWLRPMDYVTMPPELLERCSPVRRQLLGDAKTQLGYYLPTDEDAPLRVWWQARQQNQEAAW